MNTFAKNIAPYVERELSQADACLRAGSAQQAFSHLENAHVLGQRSTRFHVKAHVRMLQWAWQQNDIKEGLGQILRIIGALTKTVFGWVPTGNTGGANVSPFKPMPLKPAHRVIINRALKH